ncbi:MAG TPA: PHP domain-containing protein [Egibacteraceae bacterium]|nr:PHP domain-containing protein [Egibacteraceae bacterium]
MYDLHTHTVFSDGTTTPEDNAALAAAAGLDGVALTDHDTLDGWERMAAACEAAGVEFVPGVELSAEADGRSVHVLGYWVDPADPALRAECVRLRAERERRGRVMVERLAAHGTGVTWDEVAVIAGPAPVGRPHLASALVARGAARDIEHAFTRWLAEDGPVHEPKRALAPAAAVRLVVEAGGAAVLAHPASTFPGPALPDALLDELRACGLRGLEADHPAHDEASTRRWRDAAASRGLLVTGASDFHGGRKAVRIGTRTTPDGVVALLREASRGGARW